MSCVEGLRRVGAFLATLGTGPAVARACPPAPLEVAEAGQVVVNWEGCAFGRVPLDEAQPGSWGP